MVTSATPRHALLAALALLLFLGLPAGADTAIDMPPLIGKLQVIRWHDTDDVSFDGTVLCAVFGGPENVPPPSPFDASFSFVGGQYRPNNLDPDVGVQAPLDADRDFNWIYVFQFVNDEGDDEVKGQAIWNAINLAFPPCIASIDGAYVTPGESGAFLTEYGATLDGGGRNGIGGMTLLQEFLFATITSPVLRPGDISEVLYYTSPFAPGNRNAAFLGQSVGQSRAHTVGHVVPTPQFFPRASCSIDHVSSTLEDGEAVHRLSCTVTAEAASLDPVSADPNEPGNLLQIHDPIGGPRPIASFLNLGISAGATPGSCIRFRLEGGAETPGPLETTLLREVDSARVFHFTIVRPVGCEDDIEVSAELAALEPYDADPPFEGHTKEDGAVALPELDADGDPCGFFLLAVPTPGTAAAVNTFQFSGAEPGQRVFLVAGLNEGSTPIPGCGGLAVAIADPRREAIRSVLADGNGRGQITLNVPPLASSRTVLFQLVQFHTDPCRVSSLVQHTFP